MTTTTQREPAAAGTNPLGTLRLKDPQCGVDATIETHTFLHYHDGFSFGVHSEIDAFKAAYIYRSCKRTTISFAAHSGWRVSVYTIDSPRTGQQAKP